MQTLNRQFYQTVIADYHCNFYSDYRTPKLQIIGKRFLHKLSHSLDSTRWTLKRLGTNETPVWYLSAQERWPTSTQAVHPSHSLFFLFLFSFNKHTLANSNETTAAEQTGLGQVSSARPLYIYISIPYYIILYCIVYFTTIHRCPGRSHVQFGLFSFGLAALAFAAAGHCVCESRHTHKSGKEEDGDETLCLFVLSCCC